MAVYTARYKTQRFVGEVLWCDEKDQCEKFLMVIAEDLEDAIDKAYDFVEKISNGNRRYVLISVPHRVKKKKRLSSQGENDQFCE